MGRLPAPVRNLVGAAIALLLASPGLRAAPAAPGGAVASPPAAHARSPRHAASKKPPTPADFRKERCEQAVRAAELHLALRADALRQVLRVLDWEERAVARVEVAAAERLQWARMRWKSAERLGAVAVAWCDGGPPLPPPSAVVSLRGDELVARLTPIAAIFKAMRPRRAAAILTRMPPGVAAGILAALPGRAAGAIAAALPPSQAAQLTRTLGSSDL